MKTQEILTRVNDALRPFEAIEKARDSRDVNAWSVATDMRDRLAALVSDLEAQVRGEIAASNGTVNATRTITRILNRCKKESFRTSLHYAWQDKDGRQCICDGFQAYRLKEPLPLEPRPDNAGDPIDLDKIFPDIGKDYAPVPLPSLQEVKSFIAIERAKYTGKRGGFVALWDFGAGKPVVNAEYLRDLLQVFPDAAEIFCGTGLKMLSPLVVRCDAGDAVMLPVRASRCVAEIAAIQQEKADAEQAIKDMAEAEGHDPEYIREREERRAKRKVAAKKALDDNLSRIRMEMALSENYALEMDEFEYLVYLMDEAARVA